MPADESMLRRARYRAAAVAANAEIPNLAADAATAADRFTRWRQFDPLPHIPAALLNGADIADYIRLTGMVHPFDPRALKPASLEIRLEGEYLFYDRQGKPRRGWLLQADHPDFAVKRAQTELIVPGNSIVFVTVAPRFQMPDYIAMRFNLKIDHVYKGLLLGTGPLVDPGFVGRLHIPLHNLTQEDYTFSAGDGLIWAEFTKLSPHPLFSAATERSAHQVGQYPPLKVKSDERAILDYIREGAGETTRPRSSIPQAIGEAQSAVAAAQQAAEAATSATTRIDAFDRRLRNAGIIAAIFTMIAVIGAYTAVLQPSYALVRDAVTQTRVTDPEVTRQQQEIDLMEERIARLEAALSSSGPSAPG